MSNTKKVINCVNVMPDIWADLSHLTCDEKREYYRAKAKCRAMQRYYRLYGREYFY